MTLNLISVVNTILVTLDEVYFDFFKQKLTGKEVGWIGRLKVILTSHYHDFFFVSHNLCL